MSVKSVTVKGQKYKVGCMFVCDVTTTDEIPIFVFVKHIIQVTNMWLICGIVYDAVCFNMHCHAYEFETTGEWVAFQAGQMLDNQCPSIYQYMSKLLVIMRHRVFRLQYFVVYSCITSFFGDFREFGCQFCSICCHGFL